MKNIKKIMITVVKENLSPIVDLFIYRFDLRIGFILFADNQAGRDGEKGWKC